MLDAGVPLVQEGLILRCYLVGSDCDDVSKSFYSWKSRRKPKQLFPLMSSDRLSPITRESLSEISSLFYSITL